MVPLCTEVLEIWQHDESAAFANIEVFINVIILAHWEVDKQEKDIYIYIDIYI